MDTRSLRLASTGCLQYLRADPESSVNAYSQTPWRKSTGKPSNGGTVSVVAGIVLERIGDKSDVAVMM